MLNRSRIKPYLRKKSLEIYKSNSKNILIENIDHTQEHINSDKLYIAFNSNFVHFMLNYVVVLKKDQPSDEILHRQLYLYGLYLLCKKNTIYFSILSHFGEDLVNIMKIALEKNNPDFLMDNLILSEYPANPTIALLN